MKVLCPKCGVTIPVSTRPAATTDVRGVNVTGNVNIEGGGISFGPGGAISFGPGGQIAFGGPSKAASTCLTCGEVFFYSADDVTD